MSFRRLVTLNATKTTTKIYCIVSIRCPENVLLYRGSRRSTPTLSFTPLTENNNDICTLYEHSLIVQEWFLDSAQRQEKGDWLFWYLELEPSPRYNIVLLLFRVVYYLNFNSFPSPNQLLEIYFFLKLPFMSHFSFSSLLLNNFMTVNKVRQTRKNLNFSTMYTSAKNS